MEYELKLFEASMLPALLSPLLKRGFDAFDRHLDAMFRADNVCGAIAELCWLLSLSCAKVILSVVDVKLAT